MGLRYKFFKTILSHEMTLRVLPCIFCAYVLTLMLATHADKVGIIVLILSGISLFGLNSHAGNVISSNIVSLGLAIISTITVIFVPSVLSQTVMFGSIILISVMFFKPDVGTTTYNLISPLLDSQDIKDILLNQETKIRNTLPLTCRASKITIKIINSPNGLLIHNISALHQDGSEYLQSLYTPLDTRLGFLNCVYPAQTHYLPARSAHFIMNGLRQQVSHQAALP